MTNPLHSVTTEPRIHKRRFAGIGWCVNWLLLWLCCEYACAADLSARVETGLRKSLAFYEHQQHGGGWASAYSLDLDSRWGEWLPVEKNVITVNHDATTGIGLIYLRASKVLKEPSYREIARQAGDLLVSGQPKHGGFPEELRLTSEGVEGVGNQGVLEDHATDRATELLLQLFDATGEEQYRTAARKAVDFLVTAQYPSGAFPQRYPLAGNSYSRLYDMTTGEPLIVERATGRRVQELKELPEDKRQRWYIGPLFEQRPATAVSTVQTWNRLRVLGRKDLLAQRLKRTGRPDIESGYGAFRTPQIATEKDCLALIGAVESILHEQNPAGWWPGQWYNVDAIPSYVFTRNAINLITYLDVSDEENENSR